MMGKLEEMLDKIDPGDAEKVREFQDYLRMRAALKQARADNNDAAKEIHSLHTQLAAVTAERDRLREAMSEVKRECREWAASSYWSTESLSLCNRLTEVARKALAATEPKGE